MVNDPIKPKFIVTNTESLFDITIPQTQAFGTSNGNTYNQAGITYNQAGYIYEGVSLPMQDIQPLSLTVGSITPHISVDDITDVYRPNNYLSVGPGFFMFVTYRSGVPF